MRLKLHIWRQKNASTAGRMVTYEVTNISSHMSFLEMLDVLNEGLDEAGEEPVTFDHDCREGICGACSLTINGVAHGPESGTTTCQLHMRHFNDGDDVHIEPWRAKAFPVIKDLMTDRSSFDRIINVGGFVSVNTGSACDANDILVPKVSADLAMDYAACIGCGACVASCKNASAMLFVGAKVSHLANLPQGKAEANRRALAMVEQMDAEGFGNCTNQYECEAVCPKEIPVSAIAQLNREYVKASVTKN